MSETPPPVRRGSKRTTSVTPDVPPIQTPDVMSAGAVAPIRRRNVTAPVVAPKSVALDVMPRSRRRARATPADSQDDALTTATPLVLLPQTPPSSPVVTAVGTTGGRASPRVSEALMRARRRVAGLPEPESEVSEVVRAPVESPLVARARRRMEERNSGRRFETGESNRSVMADSEDDLPRSKASSIRSDNEEVLRKTREVSDKPFVSEQVLEPHITISRGRVDAPPEPEILPERSFRRSSGEERSINVSSAYVENSGGEIPVEEPITVKDQFVLPVRREVVRPAADPIIFPRIRPPEPISQIVDGQVPIPLSHVPEVVISESGNLADPAAESIQEIATPTAPPEALPLPPMFSGSAVRPVAIRPVPSAPQTFTPSSATPHLSVPVSVPAPVSTYALPVSTLDDRTLGEKMQDSRILQFALRLGCIALGVVGTWVASYAVAGVLLRRPIPLASERADTAALVQNVEGWHITSGTPRPGVTACTMTRNSPEGPSVGVRMAVEELMSLDVYSTSLVVGGVGTEGGDLSVAFGEEAPLLRVRGSAMPTGGVFTMPFGREGAFLSGVAATPKPVTMTVAPPTTWAETLTLPREGFAPAVQATERCFAEAMARRSSLRNGRR